MSAAWNGEVIGHRGAAGLAPENTLEAFELALSLGVDGVELDVRRTADGHAVVFHDATLERFLPPEDPHALAPVSALPLERLRGIDVGAPFGQPGCRMPTLDEVLDAFSTRTALHVECKGAGEDGLRTLEPCLAALRRHPGSAVLSSFHPEVLSAARAAAREIPRALIVGRDGTFPVHEATGLGCTALHVAGNVLDACTHADAREAGLLVRVWTINSEHDLRTAASAGIDGIITDFPDRLLALVGRIPIAPAGS